MYFQLFDVFLAKKYKIPVFILPNSIGPLKNRLARKIVLKALKYAKVVYVRESTSLKYLKTEGINALKSPDLGFYLKPSKRDFKNYLHDRGVFVGDKKCIALTLRPYRFDGKPNADELYDNYLTQIKTFILDSLSKGMNVTLMAHTIGPSAHEDDTIPLLEIYNSMEAHKNLIYLHDRDLNSEDLEKIYSYYDLVVGTRFHSVIFALNVNTPALAIAYGGNKAVGIMNDMELSEFVVPIENPKANKLIDLSNTILNNTEDYISKIEKYKVKLQHEKRLLIDKIQEFYS
jgi:colanic acid/amylovoran biosynthesis protein